MSEKRREALCLAAVFFGVLLADWSFLSKAYVFEGLARAMPIEVGRWRELSPGHYVAYGPLGWLFHAVLGAFGFVGTALTSLQLLDGLLGAAGAAVQFSTLRRLGATRAAAAAWAAVLAASYAWWLWSTDAQAYIFSALLLAVAFRLAVERLAGGNVSPRVLGFAHAAALAGHLVNALFALPLAWLLWRTESKTSRRRALLEYAGAFAAGGLIVYACAALLVARPQSWEQAARWLAGSAGVAGTENVAWHGGLSPASVWAWLNTTFDAFTTVGPARLLVVGAALAAVSRLRRAAGTRRLAAQFCAVWLAAYALVFTSWEPQTLVYRVPDLIPLTTLLWLGLSSAPAGAALAAALAAANLFSEIAPRAKPENNAALGRMAFVKAHTEPRDWVTGDGGADELYLPYFAERRPLVLGQWANDPAALSRRLDVLRASGERVVVTSRVLGDERWGPFFEKRKLQPFAKRDDGFALYFLR